MRKLVVLLLAAVCVLRLAACGSQWAEGSEKTYSGTVCDIAMSVVQEGDRQGRAYIIISADDEEIRFWLAKDCENPAKIGDRVRIESAVEERTKLLVATRITLA